jgi:hypothetical protein
VSSQFYPGWADAAGKANPAPPEEEKPSIWASKRQFRTKAQIEEQRARGREKGGKRAGEVMKARARARKAEQKQ